MMIKTLSDLSLSLPPLPLWSLLSMTLLISINRTYSYFMTTRTTRSANSHPWFVNISLSLVSPPVATSYLTLALNHTANNGTDPNCICHEHQILLWTFSVITYDNKIVTDGRETKRYFDTCVWACQLSVQFEANMLQRKASPANLTKRKWGIATKSKNDLWNWSFSVELWNWSLPTTLACIN